MKKSNEMRTIRLTQDEIETIKIALQYAYDSHLEIIQANRKILNEESRSKIVESANKFWDLQNLFDGDRDAL